MYCPLCARSREEALSSWPLSRATSDRSTTRCTGPRKGRCSRSRAHSPGRWHRITFASTRSVPARSIPRCCVPMSPWRRNAPARASPRSNVHARRSKPSVVGPIRVRLQRRSTSWPATPPRLSPAATCWWTAAGWRSSATTQKGVLRKRFVRLRKKWLVALVIAFGPFMAILDDTIVNVALPQMQGAFQADFQTIAWVAMAYLNSEMMAGAKYIHTGANLDGRCLLLTLHSTYSRSRLQSHTSFGDLSAQACGDDDGRGRGRRDGDSEMKSLSINLPASGDLAVERLIRGRGEGQPSPRLWPEHDMLIPRSAWCNARNDLVEPVADRPIGIVIQGVMRVSLFVDAIPGFPDRRCASFNCIQPGGRRFLHEQDIGEIEMAVVPQHRTEIGRGEKTRPQVRVRALHQLHQALDGSGTKWLWQEIKGQCPHIGRLPIWPQSAIVLHKLCNIGFFDSLMQSGVFPRLVFFAENSGYLGQQASRMSEEGGCDMRCAQELAGPGGPLGVQHARQWVVRLEPFSPMEICVPEIALIGQRLSFQVAGICISFRRVLILRLLPFILDPGFHAGILFLQDALIPKAPVQRPGNDDRRIAPARCAIEPGDGILRARQSPFRRGDDVAHHSICLLFGCQISQPFGEEARGLHQKGAGGREDLSIARPSCSLAGRAIGRNL